MSRKKQILKQSTKLAQGQSYPSLTQAKAYKYLLYKAFSTLSPGSIHTCSASELKEALNFHDYRELRKALESLVTVQIQWETLGRSDVVWGRSPLLADCILLNDGNFKYSFSPVVVQELMKPKRYRMLNLSVLLGFVSTYALKIYEGSCSYFDPKRKCGSTPRMTYDKLREWLNVPEEAYPRKFDFFRNCIHKPLAEANERGELCIALRDDRSKPKARLYWFECGINPNKNTTPEIMEDMPIYEPLPNDPDDSDYAAAWSVEGASPPQLEPKPRNARTPSTEDQMPLIFAAFSRIKAEISAVEPAKPYQFYIDQKEKKKRDQAKDEQRRVKAETERAARVAALETLPRSKMPPPRLVSDEFGLSQPEPFKKPKRGGGDDKFEIDSSKD